MIFTEFVIYQFDRQVSQSATTKFGLPIYIKMNNNWSEGSQLYCINLMHIRIKAKRQSIRFTEHKIL